MDIINFVATPEDGIIKIPKEFLKKVKDESYIVLILNKSETTPAKKKKKHLTAFRAKTKGLVVNREEANVRKIFS